MGLMGLMWLNGLLWLTEVVEGWGYHGPGSGAPIAVASTCAVVHPRPAAVAESPVARFARGDAYFGVPGMTLATLFSTSWHDCILLRYPWH